MSSQAIAESHGARRLLELATAGADCRVGIGGRTVLLSNGAIAEVQGTPEDISMLAFLAGAGRISEAEREAIAQQTDGHDTLIERALLALPELTQNVLLDARRALYLERLVRGLAKEDADGTRGTLSAPLEGAVGPTFDTVALVLDALARRAAHGEAEIVGALHAAKISWLDAPGRERAAVWAQLGEVPSGLAVGQLFSRHPAAPSRIAALVRAGVARLEIDEKVRATAIQAVGRPAPMPSPHVGPLGITKVAPWIPKVRGPLEDPLAPLEAQLATLGPPSDTEHAGERARIWLGLAEIHRRQQHSLPEATRAAREAVAAAPDDEQALALAAELTGASGAPELAYAYARALSDRARSSEVRARALKLTDTYARRAGLAEASLKALESAVELTPEDWTLHAQLARALHQRGDLQAAVERALSAATRARGTDPEQACTILEWAAKLVPSNLRTWDELGKSIIRHGRPRVAAAILAHAARKQSDLAVRARLRLTAIAIAEQAGDGALASELLIEAIDGGSFLPEPLAKHLEASAQLELAVIASELAARTEREQRGRLLVCAARAYERLPNARATALELMCEGLLVDPQRAYEPLISLAREPQRSDLVRDALERAVRTRCPDRDAARALDGETRVQVIWLIERLRDELTDVTSAPLDTFVTELLGALDGRVPTPAEAQLLAQRGAAFTARAEQLEAALRAAPAAERSMPAKQLAALLRCDPARRSAARRLYEKVLEREPDDLEALAALRRLLWLQADDVAACALLERRAAGTGAASDHLAHAYAAQRIGERERARTACRAALAHGGPEREEALVLAWRLALAARDHAQVDASLRALVADANESATRARRLLRLARAQRELGQREEALRSVDEALATDDDAVEAALWLRDEAASIPPGPRITALRRAQIALGDSPELLRLLARASYAVHDPRGQRDALEALRALTPEDGFAARGLVALLTTGSDAAALSAALRLSLSPARFTTATLGVAETGLARLAAIADATRAVEIVVAAVEQLGEQARPLLRWAHGIAHELPTLALRIQVAELEVAHASLDEQPELLRGIAALWRDQEVAWAEARTYLRLLALRPDDPRALERLLAIYAASGEAERLEAVLGLSFEFAATEQVRRERLFERAQCAAQLQGDRALAATLIAQALTPTRAGGDPQAVPTDVLRRGVGLLCALDPERAIAQLLELAESAPPERARDLAEEALALAEHTLGLPALALKAAIEGTLRHPDHEPFLRALERIARSAGALDQLVSTLESAADRSRDPERQADLFVRAATLAEVELMNAERACLALDQAYRATPTRAIEELLVACAGRLFARDARAGKLAYDRLRDALHVRAKFGPPLGRARALVTLSRLAIDVYLTHDDGERYAQAAETILAAAVDAPRDLRNELRDELDALKGRLSRESMRVTLQSPGGRPELSLGFEEIPPNTQGAPTVRPARAHAAMTVRPLSMDAAPALRAIVPVEIRSQAAAAVTLAPERTLVEPNEASSVLTRAHVHDDTLIDDVVRGDSAALLALTDQLSRDRDRAPTICTRLLAEVRERGFSVCALRGLRVASAGASAHALWRTSSQALGFFEPTLRPPPATRRRDAHGARALTALKSARESPHAGAFQLLAQLVEAAAPLFRNGRGKPERALTPLRDPPFGQLLGELAQLFETRLEAYPMPASEDRVSLFSAQPASIAIGSRTPRDAAALRFRLARAFEYARPENLLLVTLSTPQAETLFGALRAAFAPADTQHEKVSREAAALASELWRTMPSPAQRNLARFLAQLEQPLDVETLSAATRLRGARVALFMTRELDVALAQLGLDGDPAGARLGVSEGELDRALRDVPLVRDLLAYAFSEAYLDSVSDT